MEIKIHPDGSVWQVKRTRHGYWAGEHRISDGNKLNKSMPTNFEKIEEEANEKFFSIEPNLGQKKHCDICGHDHTCSGTNENSGQSIKLFYRQKIKELMLEMVGEDERLTDKGYNREDDVNCIRNGLRAEQRERIIKELNE